MSDKTIVVSGRENVAAFEQIRALNYWRHTANMIKFGIRPRKGWTIKKFNESYKANARTWEHVGTIATEILRGKREG
jgi:hypothetical protein